MSSRTALENTSTSFTITVHSLSNNPTGVDLTVTTNLGWAYQMGSEDLILDPSSSRDVTLSVMVPHNAPPGDRETLMIEAVAKRNHTAFSTVSVSVMVEMQTFDVTIELDMEQVFIASGETVWVTGTVSNLGNNVDDVSLEANAPAGWTTNFHPESLLIDRGKGATFEMDLTAPASLTGTGLLLLNITARSQGLVEEAMQVLRVQYNKAELVIDGGNVTVNPSTPTAGDEVTIQATVRNLGAVPADGTEVAIFSDSGEIVRVTLSSLPSGGLAVARLSWYPVPGTSLVRVVVDPDGKVPETDEGNNEHPVTIHVTSSDLSVSPSDLVLDPAYPSEGSEVTVRFRVTNDEAVAAGPFDVVLTVDDELLETFPLEDGLVGGGNISLTASWIAIGGRHTFSVEVDPDGNVVEEDRSDNLATRSFSVNAQPIPNLTVDKSKILVDGSVELDGSRSSDPDGRVRQYFFDYGDGSDSGWSFTARVNHTYTEAGEFVIRLYVRDEAGAQSGEPSNVTVMVDERESSSSSTPGPAASTALMALATMTVFAIVARRRSRGKG
jgi:uncharacterized repeat protein (TIGR01451 family)